MLEPFLGTSEFANHGQRVVEGQRLMQAASDIMLGWIAADGVDGVDARLLRPPALGREGIGARRGDGARRAWPPTRRSVRLDARPRARPLRRRASRSPATSAAATRSTARWPSFAEAYADQNERDYAALQDAVASGRVDAESGL